MWTCEDCGQTHDDNFTACWNCGNSRFDDEELSPPVDEVDSTSVKPHQPAAQHVESHLLGAILVTLCCCLPFGIVAIVYAAQVDPKLAAGDYEGAVRSSESAQTWIAVGIVFGVLGVIVSIVARG